MPLDWPDSPIAAGAVHDAIAGFARLLPDGYQDRPIQSAALREMSPTDGRSQRVDLGKAHIRPGARPTGAVVGRRDRGPGEGMTRQGGLQR